MAMLMLERRAAGIGARTRSRAAIDGMKSAAYRVPGGVRVVVDAQHPPPSQEELMRTAICAGSLLLLAMSAIGCGGEKKTVVHRETVQTAPVAPVIQERRTVERIED
jgi:hypothetical protein